jgi:hypothetical protein
MNAASTPYDPVRAVRAVQTVQTVHTRSETLITNG